jgi:hypothetical protein
MAHARKQIRDAVVALLDDLSTTGTRCFASRVYSLQESELPSISVFAVDAQNDELVTKITMGTPPRFHRVCPLVIEGHALVDDNIDDTLDQISLEVEVAMSQTLVVGSRTLSAQLQSTSKDLIGDHESQIGILRMVYTIPYVTAENTPDILE